VPPADVPVDPVWVHRVRTPELMYWSKFLLLLYHLDDYR
jgi:hypothetical protein